MKLKEVKQLSAKQRFMYWISERESIRIKRNKKLPKPWTDDPILQTYRFCNVRRMDDKVSQWLLKNWYKPFYNHEYMVVACAVARHFNLPSSLEAIGFPGTYCKDPNDLHTWLNHSKRILLAFKAKKLKVFNNAYVISGGTCGGQKVKYDTKIEGVIEAVIRPMVDNLPPICTDFIMPNVETLKKYKGFASFMAGQVAMDLRHAIDGEWLDKNTYAPVGPGSSRGLCRLLGRTEVKKTAFNQKDFERYLIPLVEEVRDKYPRLEAMDVQSCLCEWDKWERCLWAEGKPKQLYAGV